MAVTPQPPHDHRDNHPLQPPSSIITIDMSSLSHSELHSLSLLSSSSSPPSTPPSSQYDAVSTSAINPSQSTHQQTYSLSPRRHHHHRRFSLLNQELLESNLIVAFLKEQLPFGDYSAPPEQNVTVEIVNRNGVVVDLAALEEREGAFSEELMKRAGGREKEEELLQMLAEIEGDWCSRRKKRRVIDASFLGDALPVGWKIIVALRRKGGRFFPYCRRFISPTGEHLSSCKEVSSYLQPYFGINDAKLVSDNRIESQQVQTLDSVNRMCVNSEHGNFMLDPSNSTMHNRCVPIENEKEASILGIDNLPDVQVCDLYECHSCKISFDAKDKYLQHTLAVHQKTTKRYTIDLSVGDKVIVKDGKDERDENSGRPKKRRRHKQGSSVSDGVIITNGKYECQFCHKVFEERRRYLGHVGNHVKGSIKMPNDSFIQVNGSAKALCVDKSPASISNSRMDALIEIAQSSTQDINTPLFEKESSVNNVERLSVAENSQGIDANRKTKEDSGSCLTEVDMLKNCIEGKTFAANLYHSERFSKNSSTSANETAKEGFEEGKTLSQELQLPCTRVNEVSLVDADVNHSDLSPGGREEEDIGEDKILPSELNLQDKLVEISRIDECINIRTSYTNECEIDKNVIESKTLSNKMNPLAKMSKISATDEEINGQFSTCSMVNSEKNSSSVTSVTPDATSGVAEIVTGSGRCNSAIAENKKSADDPVEVNKNHHLCSKEVASDPCASGKKILLENAHECEPQHAQMCNDSELVAVSGKQHDSSCAVPQSSLNSSSTFDEIFEKAGQDICSLDQNLESEAEYMKLDVIEPQMYKYNEMNREDSISFYDVSMDLENNIGLGLGLDNSPKSQSGYAQEMASRCLTTTVCVWCGFEFSHEIADVEPQPDSVGFMCPACRAKISKQFNELESNFSLSSHC